MLRGVEWIGVDREGHIRFGAVASQYRRGVERWNPSSGELYDLIVVVALSP